MYSDFWLILSQMEDYSIFMEDYSTFDVTEKEQTVKTNHKKNFGKFFKCQNYFLSNPG